MEEKRKTSSINNFFRLVSIFPIVYFAVFIVANSTFSILYTLTDNIFYFYFLLGFSIVMIGVYIIYALYTTKKFDKVFVRGLYNITSQNLKNIANNEIVLLEYPNDTYQEFNLLNREVRRIGVKLDRATLIFGNVDYSHINLDYIDRKKSLVNFSNFKKHLEDIIFSSQNYRNVIIELYYDLGDGVLTDLEVKYLLSVLSKNFSDYQGVLYVLREDRKSIYIYLPRIDSLSKVTEQLEICSRNVSINKRTPEGIANLTARFAVVCYPFSNVQELLPDLQYAKREEKETINLYLPNRLESLEKNRILKNSMNLNAMTKIITPLLGINLGLENIKKTETKVREVLNNITTYFSIDYSGFIAYDEVKRKYLIPYQITAKGLSPLGQKDKTVELEFVQSMDQARDSNYSYYFSSRSHANIALGRHLDRVGIESGFFYILKEGDSVIGAIYFFNKNKPFIIDSYIQEAFVVLCDKIAAAILRDRHDAEVDTSYREIDSILKLTEYATYRVADEEFTLLRASSTMKSLFPKLKIGEKCYKTLYGLNKPCADCPLISGNKKVVKSGKNRFETSLILSEMRLTYHVMTIKNLYQEESQPRYHQDLIINSFQSLCETLDNYYLINGKGYLLILRIDNLAALVEENGSEGYLLILRNFIKRFKDINNSLENIYFFNNQSLALLFAEHGQSDIFEVCEKIYELSRRNPTIGVEYELDFTYLPVSYPGIYTSAVNLIRQALQYATKGKYELNKSYIYVDEGAYSRSANKNEYLLDILESSFGNKTFNVNLQPVVNAKDKTIFGAELLLRVSDSYRNVTIRTDELVNIAAMNNKVGIISKALLDYVSSMYEQYGNSIFKIFGFSRLSINTDYYSFTDENFFEETKKYVEKLPNNFLAFEINESDVANHREEFKEIVHQSKNLHVVMVVDQYTGRYLSPEAVKNIGFSEIKVSRYVINNIDNDRQKLSEVRQLLLELKDLDIKTSAVGVENIDQYQLLKEIDDTVLIQGYYFYRPLEKQALIEAIRDVNRNVK
ncbi:MAG TPA: EAL domain-containing protein [Erysipelotrichaceae bacterium]|nr:EAL domain-containing protein [Erysipelotrichaceae bacterium]